MAEAIEHVLEQCLQDLLAGRTTVEECLARYPAQAAQLQPLLTSADWLRSAPARPALTAARRQALENRVLARVTSARVARPLPKQPRTFTWPLARRGWAWAVAVVALFVALTTTAVSASAASLPGDLLYPVKRLTEQVAVTLTPSTDQAALHAEFAQRRLDEFVSLMERGAVQPDLLTEMSADMNYTLDNTRDLPPDQQAVLLTTVDQLDAQQVQVIQSVVDKAPAAARTQLDDVLANIVARREEVQRRLEQVDSLLNEEHGHSTTPPPTAGQKPGDNSPGQPGNGKGQPQQPDKPGNGGQGSQPNGNQGQGGNGGQGSPPSGDPGQGGKGKPGK